MSHRMRGLAAAAAATALGAIAPAIAPAVALPAGSVAPHAASRFGYTVNEAVPVPASGAVAVDGITSTAYVSSTAGGRSAAAVVDLASRKVVTTIAGAAGLTLVVDPTRQRLLASTDSDYSVYSTTTRRLLLTSPRVPGYENLRGQAALDAATGTGYLTFTAAPHPDFTGITPIDARTGYSDFTGFGAQGCGGGLGVDAVRRHAFLATDLALSRFDLDAERGGNASSVTLGTPADRFPCADTHVPLAVDSATGVVWLSGGGRLFAVDGSTMRVLTTLNVAADQLAVDVDTHSVYALRGAELTVVDAVTGQVDARVALPRPAGHLAVDSVRHEAVLTDAVGVTTVDQHAPATPVDGGGQVAHPGDRFLAPLTVSATGVGGGPAAGVPVRFEVLSGPAAFESGSTVADGVTGTDGRASSPPLVAGATTGTVAVRATINGARAVSFNLTVTPRPALPPAYADTTTGATGQLQVPGPVAYAYGPLTGSVRTASGAPAAYRHLVANVVEHATFDSHDPVRPDQVFTDAAGSFTIPGVVAPGNFGPVLVTVEGDGVQASGWLLSNPDPDRPSTDLAVSVAAPTSLPVGRSGLATVTVTNRGTVPLAAGDVLAGVSATPGLQFGAGPADAVFAREQVVVVDPGALPAGGRRSFTVPVVARMRGNARLTAGVVAGVRDTRPADNGTAAAVTVG